MTHAAGDEKLQNQTKLRGFGNSAVQDKKFLWCGLI